jgi:hypothetical protein
MKDRSYAHRIHQSNIDRQRNAAYFMARPVAPQPPAPRSDFWTRTKTFFKGLWTKIKEIVND